MWSDLTVGPSLRSNDGSLVLASRLSGGYKSALVLRCVGLVKFWFITSNVASPGQGYLNMSPIKCLWYAVERAFKMSSNLNFWI